MACAKMASEGGVFGVRVCFCLIKHMIIQLMTISERLQFQVSSCNVHVFRDERRHGMQAVSHPSVDPNGKLLEPPRDPKTHCACASLYPTLAPALPQKCEEAVFEERLDITRRNQAVLDAGRARHHDLVGVAVYLDVDLLRGHAREVALAVRGPPRKRIT